ncbi:MAG: hypothetical protein OEZ55_09255 [Nitrospinota bacterium]|nr:hypothetical protein [Nitrospinota bacterium]
MNKTTALATALAVALMAAMAAPADAKVFSKSTAKVTQLRIVHSGASTPGGDQATFRKGSGPGLAGKSHPALDGPAQPGMWGVYSDYIGPGDINRLLGIEIYLDSYNRISAIKVTRESYNGDVVTSLFTEIVEFSIQTLKPGSSRPSKETPIVVRTADEITIP